MDSMAVRFFGKPMQCCLLIYILISAVVASAQTPLLTEVMNFAPIPVGAKRDLARTIDKLPSGGIYQVVQAPYQPFTLVSDTRDLTVENNEINIRVEFAPILEGDYRDEILLRRSPATGQSSVDEIRIRLFGTAFKIIRTDDVEFGSVMTRDTAKQIVLYRASRNDDFDFEYTGDLQPPFYVLTPQGPVRRGMDTLAVVVAFSPQIPGSYSDTIGLLRKDRQGRRLDTAYIEMNGTGRIMQSEYVVNLQDLIVGDYASRDIVIDLPVRVYTTMFSYTVEPRNVASYTSARVKNPVGPSKNQQIEINVVANPTSKVDERSTYILKRSDPTGFAVDSTRIVLDVRTASRPVVFNATLDADTIDARIGDTLVLHLLARTTNPVDEPVDLTGLTFSISYNPTMFVPLLQANQQRSVDNDRQIITTTIDASQSPIRISQDGDELTKIRGVVAMGDANVSTLGISTVRFTTQDALADSMQGNTSVLRITNAWRYADGRMRLVNPLQDLLVLEIDPNPVTSASSLRIRNLPRDAASLVIVDALGVVRADLTKLLRDGKRDFTIASSGSADAVVEPGTYYARCAVESLLGGTLNSVVRIFVVQ